MRWNCKTCRIREDKRNIINADMRKIKYGKRMTKLYLKLKARRVYKRKRERILENRRIYTKLGITKNTKALLEGDFAEHVKVNDGKETKD